MTDLITWVSARMDEEEFLLRAEIDMLDWTGIPRKDDALPRKLMLAEKLLSDIEEFRRLLGSDNPALVAYVLRLLAEMYNDPDFCGKKEDPQ